jgi:hypothetical protein
MISNFITEVKRRGLARTNRYTVHIPFPISGQWAVGRDTAEITNLLCDSVSLPGINIATTPQRFYGEIRELPYEKAFDPVTMTFYVDSQMDVKTAFDKWMALIIDPFNRTIGYYEDYVRDIEIRVENIDGSQPIMIKLFEAYPKTVGSIQLDSGNKDVMKLSVTWQYKYWISTQLGSPAIPTRTQDGQSVITGGGYKLGDIIPG